jgi:hypothetical protein
MLYLDTSALIKLIRRESENAGAVGVVGRPGPLKVVPDGQD